MVRVIPKTTRILERFAARNTSIYRIISLYYKGLVKEEVALANIQPTDKVLCIGGGPCPFSGILLHEYTGAHVTIIDSDACCVRISRELIQKLGYAKTIEVLHRDGNHICPQDFNIIHMAVQVCPMEQVFGNLKQGCRFGAKILVRLPKNKLKSFYLGSDASLLPSCCKKAVHSWRNIDSTALFIKS